MKYITLILLVLLSFTSFSQDTSDVCMPYTVAKQIAQDLVVGDSAQEILVYTTKELALTQNKVALKDSIITTYRTKELNLLEQVRNERMAKDAYITMYNTLEGDYNYVTKQYKNQKFINRVYKVGFWGGLAAGVVGYIILTK
jgi:hypothetical protein